MKRKVIYINEFIKSSVSYHKKKLNKLKMFSISNLTLENGVLTLQRKIYFTIQTTTGTVQWRIYDEEKTQKPSSPKMIIDKNKTIAYSTSTPEELNTLFINKGDIKMTLYARNR